MVWWWLLLRKPHSWSLSLTVSSVVSSLSLLFPPVSAILWHVLLRLFLDLDTDGGVDPLGEFPLCLKMFTDIAPKLSIIFRCLIRRGSFPEFGSPLI